MTPESAIAALYRQLAAHGEDVELQRLTGTHGIIFGVRCRASVRDYGANELIGDITQGQSEVILGPTEIIRSGWPGPNSSATPTDQDRRVPRAGDRTVIAGRQRSILAAMPKYLDNKLVRITLRVAG